MKCTVVTVLIAALTCGALASAHAEDWPDAMKPQGPLSPEMVLASGGQALYNILIPARPSPSSVEKAAADLASWLHKMTGAEFTIQREGRFFRPVRPVISIGNTELLARAGLRQAGIDLGEEGYGIAVQDGHLFLWGGTTRGPINAVYALLEEDLGCRWYDRRGAVRIPQHSTLAVRVVPRTYQPRLWLRDPYIYDTFDSDWALRNRIRGGAVPAVPEEWGARISYGDMHVHTFPSIFPAAMRETAPDLFEQLEDGGIGHAPCLTNPDVIRMTVDRVLQSARRYPEASVLELGPGDYQPLRCVCPTCSERKAISVTDYYVEFVNRVAEAVAGETDVMIGALAYYETTRPPLQVQPRDNVLIRLANTEHSWDHRLADWTTYDGPGSVAFRRTLAGWAATGSRLTIWDYISTHGNYFEPLPMLHTVGPALNAYIAAGVEGVLYQGSWQGFGGADAPLKAWVMAKLMWDPSLDTEALIADFVLGYYEQAGPAMLRYRQLLEAYREQGLRTGRDGGVLGMFEPDVALQILREAEDRANSEDVLTRVLIAKLPALKITLDRALGTRPWRTWETVLGSRFVEDRSDTPPDRQLADWIDEFERIAIRGEVHVLSELGRDNTVSGLIAFWRELLARPPGPPEPAAGG